MGRADGGEVRDRERERLAQRGEVLSGHCGAVGGGDGHDDIGFGASARLVAAVTVTVAVSTFSASGEAGSMLRLTVVVRSARDDVEGEARGFDEAVSAVIQTIVRVGGGGQAGERPDVDGHRVGRARVARHLERVACHAAFGDRNRARAPVDRTARDGERQLNVERRSFDDARLKPVLSDFSSVTFNGRDVTLLVKAQTETRLVSPLNVSAGRLLSWFSLMRSVFRLVRPAKRPDGTAVISFAPSPRSSSAERPENSPVGGLLRFASPRYNRFSAVRPVNTPAGSVPLAK